LFFRCEYGAARNGAVKILILRARKRAAFDKRQAFKRSRD
jgi:hypothetical protein